MDARVKLPIGIEENTENLWSVLFTTGYLTQRGEVDRNTYQLAIPNLEIRQIFADQIMEWFLRELLPRHIAGAAESQGRLVHPFQ